MLDSLSFSLSPSLSISLSLSLSRSRSRSLSFSLSLALSLSLSLSLCSLKSGCDSAFNKILQRDATRSLTTRIDAETAIARTFVARPSLSILTVRDFPRDHVATCVCSYLFSPAPLHGRFGTLKRRSNRRRTFSRRYPLQRVRARARANVCVRLRVSMCVVCICVAK